MIRITDQYLWNFIFSIFFVILVVMGAIILETESRVSYSELTVLDLTLITLATWRLVRLFVYDAVTKWFREQFYDAKLVRKQVVLHKPAKGPRRTLADLLTCPWCVSAWAGALVTFFYLLTPYAVFPTVLLAVSAVASFLQLLSNQVGHRAEQLKNQNEL